MNIGASSEQMNYSEVPFLTSSQPPLLLGKGTFLCQNLLCVCVGVGVGVHIPIQGSVNVAQLLMEGSLLPRPLVPL